MAGTYKIVFLNENGDQRGIINDFVSLSINDMLNESGSWSLIHHSLEPCPIDLADYVVIYRNGIQIFCGVVTQIRDEYRRKTRSWSWTVSGASCIEILKWRLVYPTLNISSGQYLADRFLELNDIRSTDAIINLITDNVMYDSSSTRKADGIKIIGDPVTSFWDNYAGQVADTTTISGTYRYDNLYSTVVGIAAEGKLSIIPVYNSRQDGKIRFVIKTEKDKSSNIVFTYDFDEIDSFAKITSAPVQTRIIGSRNSEETDNEADPTRYLWKYHYFGDEIYVSGNTQAQTREVLIEYSDAKEYTEIASRVFEDINKNRVETVNYDISINLAQSGYVYGNEVENYSWNMFLTDYSLGDIVGVVLNGETYTGKVSQISFDVSFGKETVTTTVGAKKKGLFNATAKDIQSLKSTVHNISKAGS